MVPEGRRRVLSIPTRLLVSKTVKQKAKNNQEVESPNQTRLKQEVVPHSVFGMRNSLFLSFDHHLEGEVQENWEMNQPFQ